VRISEQPSRFDRLFRLSVGATLALTLSACDGQIGAEGSARGGQTPSDGGFTARAVTSGPAVGRRLTREELVNSIEVVLGVDLDPETYGLPIDSRIPEGFRNSAQDLLLSPARTRAYASMAEAAVAQSDFSSFVATHAECTDMRAECIASFVARAGAFLLRAPLPDTERQLYENLFAIAADEGDGFETGAALVVRAMLQSPRFLYRLESQSGSGNTRIVDSYELATRLSFLAWNAAPDAVLVDLAERGELANDLETQVERLLNHPRARRAFRQYVEQWLYLDAIPESFALGADMKEETYRLFERVVWDEEGDFMQVFNEKQTELSGELASFYGLAPLAAGFEMYDLADVPERIGFLTNASVLAARTVNPASSMIDRGLFVLNDLFCESVPPPDSPELQAAINEVAVPETSGLSQRDRFATQSEEALCAGCHGFFDPLGLAFEQYGSAGQFILEDEFGNPLPGGGSVDVGDVEIDYVNVSEFANALAESETVARCVAEKSLQHAFGRHLGSADADLVSDVYAEFVASGRTYQSLIIAIATHPDFQIVKVAP
jgi:hypothetical protein